MKHLICSIKDRALDAYMPLFTVRTEQQAIRAFTQALKNPQEQIAQHPDDYDLYVLGHFDDNTGRVTAEAEIGTRKIADGKTIAANLKG